MHGIVPFKIRVNWRILKDQSEAEPDLDIYLYVSTMKPGYCMVVYYAITIKE